MGHNRGGFNVRKILAWIVPLLYVMILLSIGVLNTWIPNAQLWIEVTKIGLSWQVLLVILVCTLVFLFEEQIRAFLTKVKGIEVDKWKVTCQQDNEDTELISTAQFVQLMTHRDTQWKTSYDQVVATAQQTIEQVIEENKNLQEFANRVFLDKLIWQFKYADRILVLKTKHILRFISYKGSFTQKSFRTDWGNIVPDNIEQEAMINILTELNFICMQEQGFVITEDGKLYVAYLESSGQLKVEPSGQAC